jgi:hypothetical protein
MSVMLSSLTRGDKKTPGRKARSGGQDGGLWGVEVISAPSTGAIPPIGSAVYPLHPCPPIWGPSLGYTTVGAKKFHILLSYCICVNFRHFGMLDGDQANCPHVGTLRLNTKRHMVRAEGVEPSYAQRIFVPATAFADPPRQWRREGGFVVWTIPSP